jgi:hypothetical protein
MYYYYYRLKELLMTWDGFGEGGRKGRLSSLCLPSSDSFLSVSVSVCLYISFFPSSSLSFSHFSAIPELEPVALETYTV